MVDLQQFGQIDRSPLIGPCLHTIRSQDLMIPFEGSEDGLTGRSATKRGRLWGETASFLCLDGLGVRGTGEAAQSTRRYARSQQTQLTLGLFSQSFGIASRTRRHRVKAAAAPRGKRLVR